jgi:hypothetical protein
LVTRVRRRAIEHLYNVKKKFGITNEQYVQLYKDAVCAVCGASDSRVAGQPSRLVVDHNHKMTGQKSIRGILCHECNMAIGLAEDNPLMLRKMAEYLEKFEKDGGPFGGTR